jgi:hypothetical protein
MKKLVSLFLIISASVFAQEPKVIKATMQTINHGASPTSSTTYSVLISAAKKCKWSIDSLVSISSGQNVKFNIVEVNEPEATSPDYKKVSAENLKKGNYQVTFSKIKQRGGGRPGSPQNMKADTTIIEGGVLVFYTMKKKHRQLKIESFLMPHKRTIS